MDTSSEAWRLAALFHLVLPTRLGVSLRKWLPPKRRSVGRDFTSLGQPNYSASETTREATALVHTPRYGGIEDVSTIYYLGERSRHARRREEGPLQESPAAAVARIAGKPAVALGNCADDHLDAPPAITYGIALDGTELNAEANVSGSFSYAPAAGTALPVGTDTLTACFTPTDTTTYASATATVTIQVTEPTWPAGDTRLHWSDLTSLGAFRVPQIGDVSSPWQTLGDGGSLAAWDPVHQGLYLSADPYSQMVAEVGIPALKPWASNTATIGGLNLAPVLQGFGAPTGGSGGFGTGLEANSYQPSTEWSQYMQLNGLDVVNVPGLGNQLFWNIRCDYDANSPNVLSMGFSGLDYSNPQGLWRPNVSPEQVAGYMANIPAAWAAANVSGQSLLVGRAGGSGTQGATASWGPAAFAVSPWDASGKLLPFSNINDDNADLPVTPLIYYPYQTNPYPGWNPADNVGSCQWITTASGEQALVFSVVVGEGTPYYSVGDGSTGYPVDPTDSSKGYHDAPYDTQLWFYSADDLAQVAAGKMNPWDIRPYETVSVSADLSQVQRYAASDLLGRRRTAVVPGGAQWRPDAEPLRHIASGACVRRRHTDDRAEHPGHSGASTLVDQQGRSERHVYCLLGGSAHGGCGTGRQQLES